MTCQNATRWRCSRGVYCSTTSCKAEWQPRAAHHTADNRRRRPRKFDLDELVSLLLSAAVETSDGRRAQIAERGVSAAAWDHSGNFWCAPDTMSEDQQDEQDASAHHIDNGMASFAALANVVPGERALDCLVPQRPVCFLAPSRRRIRIGIAIAQLAEQAVSFAVGVDGVGGRRAVKLKLGVRGENYLRASKNMASGSTLSLLHKPSIPGPAFSLRHPGGQRPSLCR